MLRAVPPVLVDEWQLARATLGEADKPAKTTGIAYRDELTQLWLLDPFPGRRR